MSWSSDRKEARLRAMEGAILSDRMYNIALGGIILYGLLMNVLMYFIFGDIALHNPTAVIVGYTICSLIGVIMSRLSTNPLISFIGYNLVVVPIGLMIGILVEEFVKNGDADIVFQAIVLTTAITATMVALPMAFPKFFSKLGGLLFGALTGLVIVELLSSFLFSWAQSALSWIGAIIFTLYIGYDFWKAQMCSKTLDNAVDSAVAIYLDIINLFVRILQILSEIKSAKSSKRD